MKSNIIIKRLFFISLLLITINFVLTPVASRASDPEKADDVKYLNTGDDTFDRLFREARDLHDKEEWAKAIEKFKQIVCDCPEKKYVDAAFYWMAHSYKKLKMYKEAQQTLERLTKNFPNSGWASDAQVMMLELRGQIVYTPKPGQSPVTIVNGGREFYTATIEAQLDREDEIKLAAFQSLLASDPKRGIQTLGDMLRADSKSSETLKREIIRTLRNRAYRGHYVGNYWLFETAPMANDTSNQTLLRETLVRSFQSNSNAKVRAEIIYSLIAFNDDQSANYLSQLYSSESDKEIKKAIINAFGSAGTGFFTAYPSVFGQFTPLTTTVGRAQTAETLRKMEVETTVAQSKLKEVKTQEAVKAPAETAAVTTGQTNVVRAAPSKSAEFRKIYFDKLMEITRTEKDMELKRLALSNVQRFSGWSTRDGMIEILSQMYDAESDEQFKISLIQTFGNMKQDQATSKLLNIARTDKSDKLKLEAIYSLRGNKNPEVIKFLEDLIK